MYSIRKNKFKSHYRFLAALYFCFLILFFKNFAEANSAEPHNLIQGAILVQAASQPTQFQTDKVQPGQSVKIGVLIENLGNKPTPPTTIFIRFGLAKPLENEPNSVLFETETKQIDPIQPGSSLEVFFEKEHRWPSLPDFIRQDWSMREYQALINLGKKQELIGSLAVTFSAYYYPGVRKEFPVQF